MTQRKIEEARELIKYYGVERGRYFSENIKRRMDGNDEPDDNSIELWEHYQACLKIVLDEWSNLLPQLTAALERVKELENTRERSFLMMETLEKEVGELKSKLQQIRELPTMDELEIQDLKLSFDWVKKFDLDKILDAK